MTDQSNLYVLIVYPEDRDRATIIATPLALRSYTLTEAVMTITWQIKGGADASEFIVAKIDPDLPAIMTAQIDGREAVVTVHQGLFTDRAWSEFLRQTWWEAA